MIALTDEQHRAIVDAGGSPVRVEDPATKTTYVLLSADLYERVRALVEPDDLDPREFAPLMWEARKGDWDDPSMDVYDQAPESTETAATSSSSRSTSSMAGASEDPPSSSRTTGTTRGCSPRSSPRSPRTFRFG